MTKCQTPATQHKWVTSKMSATKCNTSAILHKQHKSDMSVTWTTHRHKWEILILITMWIKTFSHPYIYYMESEKLQGKEQFHSKNCLLEMPRSHAETCLKSAPEKLNFLMA